MALVIGAGPVSFGDGARAADGDPVAVTLEAGIAAVAPGQAFPVLIRQTIAKGWHSYWKNPGDNGLATSVDWRLPDGATAGPLLFPVPERFQVGGVTSYGYGRDAVLLTEIVPPRQARAGVSLTLRARIEWLACKDICIPGQADIKLDVPLADAPGAPRPALAAARGELPKAAPWPVGLAAEGKSLVLTLASAHIQAGRVRDAYFYPTEWGIVDHGAPQTVSAGPSGGLRLAVARDANHKSNPSRLDGVLVLTTAEGREAYEISAEAGSANTR